MKNGKSARYFKLGLTLFLSICGCILFYYILFHGEHLSQFWDDVVRVLLPIIDGLTIAYILSPMQNILEAKCICPLFKKSKKDHKKLIRGLATFLTILIFLLLLTIIILLIVPQVIDSIQTIIVRFPTYLDRLNMWISDLMLKFPELSSLSDNYYWPRIEEWFMDTMLPSTSSVISSFSSGFVGGVFTFLRGTFNFLIGIIISVYLLFSKEKFCAQIKKIIYALLKEDRANNLVNNMRYTNRTFGRFISGKIIDSIFIGILCFIGMSILSIPYALLISVIVGVTNVIPYFGPFLGAIPSALILLMINPTKCLVFLIFVLILQQFDGNILGPKILGDSTGLSSFWVIFAITVFGGVFGVAGMFIGVPIFAVIFATVRTYVNYRLERKMLPTDTEHYIRSAFDDLDNDEVNGKEIKFIHRESENTER